MPYVLAHDRTLHFSELPRTPGSGRTFSSGFPPLDRILPGHALSRGAAHELLYFPHHAPPWFVALSLSLELLRESKTTRLVWFDLDKTLNPIALYQAGVGSDRLLILRPSCERDLLWALAECLRSPAVGAVVALLPARLTPAGARRLQLAASSGATAIFLRPHTPHTHHHAAATRLLVEPAPAPDPHTRRWRIQLIHGHGGLLNHPVFIERHHAPSVVPELIPELAPALTPSLAADLLHSSAPISNRPGQPSVQTGRKYLAG